MKASESLIFRPLIKRLIILLLIIWLIFICMLLTATARQTDYKANKPQIKHATILQI